MGKNGLRQIQEEARKKVKLAWGTGGNQQEEQSVMRSSSTVGMKRVELWEQVPGGRGPHSVYIQPRRHVNKCLRVRLRARMHQLLSALFGYTDREPSTPRPHCPFLSQCPTVELFFFFFKCQVNLSTSFLLTASLSGQWCCDSPLGHSLSYSGKKTTKEPASRYTLNWCRGSDPCQSWKPL